jgi:GNAT superfamily N-acetyltransferase
MPDVVIRTGTPEDVATCGRICYDAFAAISAAHGFPCDLPSVEVATGFIGSLAALPGFYMPVAELDGQVVGRNFLDVRAIIAGVGPLTIDPAVQNLGVGRKLMSAVLGYAKHQRVAGIRLVQAAFHNRSLSLYTTLGFDVREPLSCVQGHNQSRSMPGCDVRQATTADLEACNEIAQRVHGFDRSVELSGAIDAGTAVVVERAGRVSGYATALAFFGHATAESNLDMQALIASVDSFGGPGILVPSRNTALLRWCLANGLRVTQPMTLMSTGLYNEPAGAWLPSVTF